MKKHGKKERNTQEKLKKERQNQAIKTAGNEAT